MRGFRSNNGPRDRRGFSSQAEESWKEVKAWNPKTWILPKDGFCEDCKKVVAIKLDDPPKQTCMICGSEKVRKATKSDRKATAERG